jgi:hypothetical protein
MIWRIVMEAYQDIRKQREEQQHNREMRTSPDPTLKTIARIRTDFPSKFGIPRQSGLVEALKAAITILQIIS